MRKGEHWVMVETKSSDCMGLSGKGLVQVVRKSRWSGRGGVSLEFEVGGLRDVSQATFK